MKKTTNLIQFNDSMYEIHSKVYRSFGKVKWINLNEQMSTGGCVYTEDYD